MRSNSLDVIPGAHTWVSPRCPAFGVGHLGAGPRCMTSIRQRWVIVRLALVRGSPEWAPRGRPREAKRTHPVFHDNTRLLVVTSHLGWPTPWHSGGWVVTGKLNERPQSWKLAWALREFPCWVFYNGLHNWLFRKDNNKTTSEGPHKPDPWGCVYKVTSPHLIRATRGYAHPPLHVIVKRVVTWEGALPNYTPSFRTDSTIVPGR